MIVTGYTTQHWAKRRLAKHLKRWELTLGEHHFGPITENEIAVKQLGSNLFPGLLGQDGRLLHDHTPRHAILMKDLNEAEKFRLAENIAS